MGYNRAPLNQTMEVTKTMGDRYPVETQVEAIAAAARFAALQQLDIRAALYVRTVEMIPVRYRVPPSTEMHRVALPSGTKLDMFYPIGRQILGLGKDDTISVNLYHYGVSAVFHIVALFLEGERREIAVLSDGEVYKIYRPEEQEASV